MQKIFISVFCCILIVVVSAVAQNGRGQGPMMGGPQGTGMHSGMMYGGMGDSCVMKGMMMGHVMPKILGTTDDGVIVLVGNRLSKYDKNLVLRAETDIKIDTARLQRFFRQMYRSCPLTSGQAQDTLR